jgi:hypothetical protein
MFDTKYVVRFWSRVNKTTSCWLWTASKSGKGGHGCIRIKNVAYYAHRFSWIIHFGDIPEHLNVLHNCPGGDNPLCVRPDHLFLGSQLDNIKDMVKKGRHPIGKGKPFAVLTEDDVRDMRIRYAQGGVMMRQLAEEKGVTPGCVSMAIRRVQWKHVE